MPHPLSLLTLLALTIPAMAAAMPVVALQPQVTVLTTEVTLGQVAPDLPAELAAVTLGSAPVPGTTRYITADYIRLRLRRCGIRPETLDLQGDGVTICHTGTTGAQATEGSTAGPQPLPLIKRNQLVEVAVQCGGVTIHTTGRAAGDASEGNLIEINLATTNRKVTGRVSRGTILVVIPGSAS